MKKRLDEHGISTHIVDLLVPWAFVEVRRMFGGYGLFSRDRMFALIFDDVLYLKDSVDAGGVPLKTSFEKEYFEYERLGKIARINFFKAPLTALEDGNYLAELAEQSWQSANVRKKRVKPEVASKRGSKASVKRGTKASVKPGTKASVKPGTKASVKRGTKASVSPGTKASVKPGTKASVKPGTKASVKPGTKASVKPGTKASVKPGTKASVKPGTKASVKRGTKASVKPGTKASVKPATQSSTGRSKVSHKPRAKPPASVLKSRFL